MKKINFIKQFINFFYLYIYLRFKSPRFLGFLNKRFYLLVLKTSYCQTLSIEINKIRYKKLKQMQSIVSSDNKNNDERNKFNNEIDIINNFYKNMKDN